MEKSVADSQSSVDVQANQPLVDVAWHVAADITAQHYVRDMMDIGNDPFKDEEQEKEKKPKSFGGCSSTTEKLDWLEELLKSSERTGNNISSMAYEAATDAVSARLEFLLGKTLFHVRYEKKADGRWENSGRDLVELFDESKPGGERKHRYQQLKDEMQGAKVGMVFSEPTVFDNVNYIQVFVDTGSTIEEYVVQYQGNDADFRSLYTSFAGSSSNPESGEHVDYNQPLRFVNDVPLDSFVAKIEESYVSDESKEQARDYLVRLKDDIKNLSKIDEHQKEAQVLANYLELQMLSQGISHAVLNLLAGALDAYAKGDTTVEDLEGKDIPRITTTTDVYEYIENRTRELAEFYGETTDVINDSVQTVFDIVDGKHGEFIQKLLRQEPKSDVDNKASFEEQWIRIVQKELGKSKKEAQILVKSVEFIHTLFKDQQKSMDIVSTMEVGYGALFFALDVMTIPDVIQPIQEQNVDMETNANISEIARQSESKQEVSSLEFIVQLSAEEKDRLFSIMLQPDFIDHIDDIKKIFPDGIDVDVFIQTFRFITRIDTLPSDKKEAIIVDEKEKTLHEMSALWETIVKMTHHNQAKEMQHNTIEGIHSPHELISVPEVQEFKEKSEKESVENFSLTLMIWMLLKVSSYYSNLEFIHKVVASQKTDSLHELVREENPEKSYSKRTSTVVTSFYHLANGHDS